MNARATVAITTIVLLTGWLACQKPVHEIKTVSTHNYSKLNLNLPDKRVQLTGDSITASKGINTFTISDTARGSQTIFVSNSGQGYFPFLAVCQADRYKCYRPLFLWTRPLPGYRNRIWRAEPAGYALRQPVF